MALYNEFNVDIATYGDTAKEGVHFNCFIPDQTLNLFTEDSFGRINLAGAASDVAFNFQSVGNAKLITLKSTSQFTVKFNSAVNAAITLTPRTNPSDGTIVPAFLCCMADGVTALYFGNAASSAIYVDVGIAGD